MMIEETSVAFSSFAAMVLCYLPWMILGVESIPVLFLCVFVTQSFLLASLFSIFQNHFQVVIHAVFLGCLFTIGIILLATGQQYHPLRIFGIYLLVFAFFHWSEYIVTSICNPQSLTISSFILNHSKQYWIAACSSWIEFILEYYLVPTIKTYLFISCIGLCICMSGEVIRKTAMITAGQNFTHLIAYHKKESHSLIQHGVYGIMRHPSYVGWFWWSIGTQLILCNPLCTIAYACASWYFFDQRVKDEEQTLIAFFGNTYLEYQRQVPTGLPFINGFVVVDNDYDDH